LIKQNNSGTPYCSIPFSA